MSKKTITSFIWSFNSRISTVFFEFLTQLILARILLPSDFGIIAIVMVFISFGRTITNAGLSQALIQKKDITKDEISSVFYFNLLLGIVFTTTIFLTSSFVSEYYSIPQLKNILRVVSIILVINALGIVHDVILTRNLNFKAKFYVNLISILVASSVSISSAIYGVGLWALVIHVILIQTIRVLILWKTTSWKPEKSFKWDAVKELIPFGANILLSSIFTGFRINIFAIILGKAYSAEQLGYYNRSNQLQNMTSKTFTTSLQNVLFPVFSKLQDDIRLLKNGLKKSLTSLFFIITPLMIFFYSNAEEIILVLLTEKWIESATYLKLLCWIGVLYPIQMMNLNALKALNLSKQFLYMTLLWDILSIFSAIVTSVFSIEIMIIGQISITLFCIILNILLNGKFYKYLLKDQFMDLLPFIIINTIYFFALKFSYNYIEVSLYLSIILKGLLAVIIYLFITFILNKSFLIELMKGLKAVVKTNK
ncbi:lipopolysaccharide biosynthesis protein [uncultured Winogradskyella sp.]|uniref:lipopolysaccharide biosynthesis protein n=1 Tax=uncultured Winogradskyella sp. TaxID=395353 RepID=UPI00262A2049|nr:lipopolysaccharide biosynthesis protein [uncultured Winogradskyella sp.]